MKGKPMVIVLIVLSGLVLTCIGLARSDWKEDNTPRTPEQIQADIHGVSLVAVPPDKAEREAEAIIDRAWRTWESEVQE